MIHRFVASFGKSKKPAKQPAYAVRGWLGVDWGPLVGLCVIIAFVVFAAKFNLLGWDANYSGELGHALYTLAILSEVAAFVFGLYIVARIRHHRAPAAVLVLFWLAASGVNVFGGVQSVQTILAPIEAQRLAQAQKELNDTRDELTRRISFAELRLPAPCPGDTLAQTACAARYEREFAIAKESGIVDQYKGLTSRLVALPLRAEPEPVAPWPLLCLPFAALAALSLVGPWCVGFGRPTQTPNISGIPNDPAENTLHTRSEAPDAGPYPEPAHPPAVAQNAPQTAALNPWPPEGYIKGGPSAEDRVREALQTAKPDGTLPSANEVAKAFVGEVSRYRVNVIANELKGRAA